MLTREEARTLMCIRRLITLWLEAECVEPPLHPIIEELRKMSDTFDTELTQLRADIAAQSTVIASATSAFTGLAAQMAAAETAARTAGATDVQIAAVSSVRQNLEANTAALAAAIPANTPAAVTPAAPTDPAATTPATPTDPAAATTAAPTDPAATPTVVG